MTKMSHLDIPRKDYPLLIMAIADELRLLGAAGLDKKHANRLFSDLMAVAGEIKIYLQGHGYIKEDVKIESNKHIIGKDSIIVHSHSVDDLRKNLASLSDEERKEFWKEFRECR